MIKKTSPHSVHITVSSMSDLDDSVNKAVDSLNRAATANNCGILVTRHRPEERRQWAKQDMTTPIFVTLEPQCP